MAMTMRFAIPRAALGIKRPRFYVKESQKGVCRHQHLSLHAALSLAGRGRCRAGLASEATTERQPITPIKLEAFSAN